MFCSGGISFEEIIAYRNDYILILAVDLYGKLLVSQYILTPSQSKQENKIVKKKKQIKEDSSDTVLNMIGEDSENLLAKWENPLE